MGRSRAAVSVLGLVLAGCSFDFTEGSSAAEGADTGSSSGDDASGTAPTMASASGSADVSGDASSQSTGSGPSTSGDPSDPTDPTGPTTTGPTTGEPTTDATTTGAFDCETPALFAEVQLVAEATSVVDPMTVVAGWGGLPGAPEVAYSTTADQGTITFTVDVPCDGTHHVWGLVWDRYHGVNSCSGVTNPDAFHVRVDDGADDQWSYGCQGCENVDAIWAWTSTRVYIASGCQTEALSYALTAGTHTIEFRNREAAVFDDAGAPNVAAIAGMAIANASTYDPNEDYAP